MTECSNSPFACVGRGIFGIHDRETNAETFIVAEQRMSSVLKFVENIKIALKRCIVEITAAYPSTLCNKRWRVVPVI